MFVVVTHHIRPCRRTSPTHTPSLGKRCAVRTVGVVQALSYITCSSTGACRRWDRSSSEHAIWPVLDTTSQRGGSQRLDDRSQVHAACIHDGFAALYHDESHRRYATQASDALRAAFGVSASDSERHYALSGTQLLQAAANLCSVRRTASIAAVAAVPGSDRVDGILVGDLQVYVVGHGGEVEPLPTPTQSATRTRVPVSEAPTSEQLPVNRFTVGHDTAAGLLLCDIDVATSYAAYGIDPHVALTALLADGLETVVTLAVADSRCASAALYVDLTDTMSTLPAR